MTDVEKAETDALLQQEPVPLNAESADKAEDRRVGMCSMKDKYSWVQADINHRAANAVEEQVLDATVEIDASERDEKAKRESARLRDQFYTEQEAYCYSEVARPAKDARETAKELVFKVIEPLGHLPTMDELGPSQFGKLAQDDTMAKLLRRTAAAVATRQADDVRRERDSDERNDGGVEHSNHWRRGGASSSAWRKHPHLAFGGVERTTMGEFDGGNRDGGARRRRIRCGVGGDGADGGRQCCGERTVDQSDWPLTSRRFLAAVAASVKVSVMRERKEFGSLLYL